MREVSGESCMELCRHSRRWPRIWSAAAGSGLLHRAAAGVKMPSSAKALGYTRNVEFSPCCAGRAGHGGQGARAGIRRPRRQRYRWHSSQGPRSLLRPRVYAAYRHATPTSRRDGLRDADWRRRAEQEHFGGGVGEISVLSDERGVGAMTHQIAGQIKGVGIGACVAEGTGVGEHGVEAGWPCRM